MFRSFLKHSSARPLARQWICRADEYVFLCVLPVVGSLIEGNAVDHDDVVARATSSGEPLGIPERIGIQLIKVGEGVRMLLLIYQISK